MKSIIIKAKRWVSRTGERRVYVEAIRYRQMTTTRRGDTLLTIFKSCRYTTGNDQHPPKTHDGDLTQEEMDAAIAIIKDSTKDYYHKDYQVICSGAFDPFTGWQGAKDDCTMQEAYDRLTTPDPVPEATTEESRPASTRIMPQASLRGQAEIGDFVQMRNGTIVKVMSCTYYPGDEETEADFYCDAVYVSDDDKTDPKYVALVARIEAEKASAEAEAKRLRAISASDNGYEGTEAGYLQMMDDMFNR